uniref:Uncharacterized protein n=1 Tax=Knipowitschia caucasica TaxID=637954 RepID=A0AAV2JFT3_KNICA
MHLISVQHSRCHLHRPSPTLTPLLPPFPSLPPFNALHLHPQLLRPCSPRTLLLLLAPPAPLVPRGDILSTNPPRRVVHTFVSHPPGHLYISTLTIIPPRPLTSSTPAAPFTFKPHSHILIILTSPARHVPPDFYNCDTRHPSSPHTLFGHPPALSFTKHSPNPPSSLFVTSNSTSITPPQNTATYSIPAKPKPSTTNPEFHLQHNWPQNVRPLFFENETPSPPYVRSIRPLHTPYPDPFTPTQQPQSLSLYSRIVGPLQYLLIHLAPKLLTQLPRSTTGRPHYGGGAHTHHYSTPCPPPSPPKRQCSSSRPPSR